jgi:hypothetical protein
MRDEGKRAGRGVQRCRQYEAPGAFEEKRRKKDGERDDGPSSGGSGRGCAGSRSFAEWLISRLLTQLSNPVQRLPHVAESRKLGRP